MTTADGTVAEEGEKTAMEILEKVAYLKGLAEGLALDKESKEGKLIGVIIDLLEDMGLEMQDLRDEQCDLEEGLDAVSDDLGDVESFLHEAFADEDEEDEDDDAEDDESLYGATCPNCGEEIYFDEETLDEGGVVCPGCGERLALDGEDVSGCGGCNGCGEKE